METKKKIALIHRHPRWMIPETNAAYPYLVHKTLSEFFDCKVGAIYHYGRRMDVLTFKTFPRTGGVRKFWKSLLWMFYAPLLVIGKGYDVIYCDDSMPFYPFFVKLFSPHSKVVLRIGDFHLMYYCKGWLYKILHSLEKISWDISDGIIAISKTMALHLVGETETHIDVVLDPVEVKHKPRPSHLHLLLKRVMFHGVLTRNKNVDMFLEAARRMPRVNFLIAGDGPDRERLEVMAPSNVTFKGWMTQDEIFKLIDTANVGVALRSDNPGNEYVMTSPFLQYLIMKKPCVVSRRKVFEAMKYPYQFSNVDDLVFNIRHLLDNLESCNEWYDYVLKNHDARKIGEQIWEILMSA